LDHIHLYPSLFILSILVQVNDVDPYQAGSSLDI